MVVVATAMSWMLWLRGNLISEISALERTALGWLRRESGVVFSGIAEPPLVIMSVLSPFGGAAGVLVGLVGGLESLGPS